MGERLLLGLSWLDGSVSTVLSERKVVKVFFNCPLFVQSCRGKFLLSYKGFGLILFSSGSMRPLDFLMFSVITLNIVFSCGEDSFFLSLFFVIL